MSKGTFEVSVVIPVFKAKDFISRAVEQVIIQPEVTEVILMEDGSPDESLQRCNELASRFPIVRVYQHAGGVNKGAAATRNAGIRYATKDYIAFADADNFYLPDRFKADKALFLADSTIDGVYNAQGVHYENEAAKKRFFEAGLGSAEFLSVSDSVEPEEFLSVMLGRHPRAKVLGGLGIDAITLHRRCFDKAGCFAAELKLQQDVHFFMKLAASCRMRAGNIREPVALRGVHGDMRSTDSRLMDEYRRLRWRMLDEWFEEHVSEQEKRQLFRAAYADFKMRDSNRFVAVWELAKSVFGAPGSISQSYGRFDLNFLAVFSNSRLVVRAISAKNRIVRSLSGSSTRDR